LTDVRRTAATSLDDSQASCAPRHGRREVGLGMLRRQMARRPPRSGGPTSSSGGPTSRSGHNTTRRSGGRAERNLPAAGAGAPAPQRKMCR
jgi:hypothetical protein